MTRPRTPTSRSHTETNPSGRFVKHLALGLLVTFVLVGVKIVFEHTSAGHRAERWTYEFLHLQLPYFNEAEELPVVVLDISRIPGGRAGEPTPREELKRLLGAVAAERPSAIAVDLDFSPDGKGWITDDDPEFFDFCLALEEGTGVPVYLGVFRTKAEPRDVWLGLPKYGDLAVALLARGEGVERLPRWIQSREGERLSTLSWALALKHEPSLLTEAKCIAWLFECSAAQPGRDKQLGERFVVSEFLVNYSKLEELRRETLLTSSGQSVKEFGARFKDKMVILGDALEFTDPFLVPGQKRPVPGAYVHASAAYTLVQQPLREFNGRFRLLLDGVISLVFIVGIFLTHGRRRGAKGQQRARVRFLFVAVGGVLLAGVLLVRWWDVMWLDFVLVGFALVIHPKVEGWLVSTLRGRGRRKR